MLAPEQQNPSGSVEQCLAELVRRYLVSTGEMPSAVSISVIGEKSAEVARFCPVNAFRDTSLADVLAILATEAGGEPCQYNRALLSKAVRLVKAVQEKRNGKPSKSSLH